MRFRSVTKVVLSCAMSLAVVASANASGPPRVMSEVIPAFTSTAAAIVAGEVAYAEYLSANPEIKCGLHLRNYYGIAQVRGPLLFNGQRWLFAEDLAHAVAECTSDEPIAAEARIKIGFEYYDPTIEDIDLPDDGWHSTGVPEPCPPTPGGTPITVGECRARLPYPPVPDESDPSGQVDHASLGHMHRARFELLSPVYLGPYYSYPWAITTGSEVDEAVGE